MDDRYVTRPSCIYRSSDRDEPSRCSSCSTRRTSTTSRTSPRASNLFGFVVRDGPNQGISEPVVVEVREIEEADTSGSGKSPEETSTGDEPDDETPAISTNSSSGEPEQDGPQAEGCGCDTRNGGTGGLALAGSWSFGGLVVGVGADARQLRKRWAPSAGSRGVLHPAFAFDRDGAVVPACSPMMNVTREGCRLRRTRRCRTSRCRTRSRSASPRPVATLIASALYMRADSPSTSASERTTSVGPRPSVAVIDEPLLV